MEVKKTLSRQRIDGTKEDHEELEEKCLTMNFSLLDETLQSPKNPQGLPLV